MPKILFRADAERSIGVGDLMSLIYLSHEFQKNSWQCFFVVKDYNPALQIIKQRNLSNVYLLPQGTIIKDEINFIKRICKDNNIHCLFMEITKNNLHDYKPLGKPTPVKACVNFDGIITEDFDIVVNWCIDFSDNLYRNYEGKNIQFIVGFKNTILPNCFDWERISERVFAKDVKKILVSMGGVDEFDLTRKIVTVLNQQKCDYEIRVIVGPGYTNQQDLSRIMSAKFRNAVLKQNVDNLFEDYLWADIVFSAGGLTSSELVATRTPSILIAASEHQIKRCEYYSGNKWAHYAGFHKECNKEKIMQSLNYVLDNINLFRNSLSQSKFEGGNEKIYKSIDSCR